MAHDHHAREAAPDHRHHHDDHDHADHDHDDHDRVRRAGGHKHGAHGHHHGHDHGGDFSRAFAIGAGLNLAFVFAEFGAGLFTHSLALMADAGHNLSDVLGLVLAWGAAALAKRVPTERRTYGLRKATVLASLANGGLLLLAVGAIAWEAIRRFADPQPIDTGPVMIVAAIGIVINGITAWLFMSGAKEDLNVRGAFLHMASDAVVSAGVVVSALVMGMTGWLWIDPAVSLVIVAVILVGTWGLLRESLDLSLDAVPPHIDSEAVRDWLCQLPGVAGVHDLHIWAMSTTESALTVHVVRPANDDGDAFLLAAESGLHERFGIGHATLQVETDGDRVCKLAPADVV